MRSLLANSKLGTSPVSGVTHRPAVLVSPKLSVAARKTGVRSPIIARQESGSVAVELLKEENEMLRASLLQNGETELTSTSTDKIPEDFWSPAIEVPDGIEYQDVYGPISPVPNHDGTECFRWDNTLWKKADHFRYRWNVFKNIRSAIDQNEGGFEKFSQGYKHFGINRGTHEGKSGLWYREWAPGAKALCLVGEFNNWQPSDAHWAFKNAFGVWELFLPDKADGTPAIPHRSKIKCRVETEHSGWVERIPAWIKWATQEWNEVQYNGVHYEPPNGKSEPGVLEDGKHYTFKYPRPHK